MNRFSDFEEYKLWVKEAKAVPGVMSNCFLMPGKVKEFIEKGCLYGMEICNGRLLLEKAEGFYRCYYFLSPELPITKVSVDAPVVIEFVYNEALTEAQTKQIELLSRMGFTLGRESSRMTLAVADIEPAEVSPEVRLAEAKDVADIRSLFEEHFNPLYSFIPDDEEWEKALLEGTVFCVYEGDILQGALFSDINKNVAELRLLCVNPESRGKGIGKMLVSFFHQRYHENVAQFAHWVDVNNSAAVKLYGKAGYIFDRRKANEYILL